MEDRSSRTSIIVALVAIVLIVGGIFLLNQSISGQQNEEESEDEVVVVNPEEEEEEQPDPTNFAECQEAGGFITQGPPEECTYKGNTFVSEVADEDETPEEPADEPEEDTPEEDTTEDEDTNDTTEDEDTTDSDITLSEGEITATVTEVNGNRSKYTVVESNNSAINTGAPMELVGINSSFGVNLQVGETYKLKVNAVRTDQGFQINSIDSFTQVN
jgi:hypothetical protein